MKTGLGLFKQLKKLYSYHNLSRFLWRKTFLGFEVANQFIQRVDKYSIQRILQKNGASIGINCDIETGLIFHNCKDYSNLIIGDNCHIGKNCFFDLRDKVELGSNVVISMQCTFITHIDISKSALSAIFPATSSPICIGDNSYLGAKTTIMKNVTIGQNVIVAAGALVNKDIDNDTIVGGVPAKFIKKIEQD